MSGVTPFGSQGFLQISAGVLPLFKYYTKGLALRPQNHYKEIEEKGGWEYEEQKLWISDSNNGILNRSGHERQVTVLSGPAEIVARCFSPTTTWNPRFAMGHTGTRANITSCIARPRQWWRSLKVGQRHQKTCGEYKGGETKIRDPIPWAWCSQARDARSQSVMVQPGHRILLAAVAHGNRSRELPNALSPRDGHEATPLGTLRSSRNPLKCESVSVIRGPWL